MDHPPEVTIGMLSKDLIRLATELSEERWPDKDAQMWYIKGIRDSAHLMILKWTSQEEQQEGTA